MTTLTDKQYKDRLNAVILLRQQGYYEQAASVASDLLRLRPGESSVWHQLGQIATSLGDVPVSAADAFGNALKLLREHGALETHALQFQATSLGYGQSLMRLGRFSEAWPYFEAGRLHVSWSPWPTTEYWDGSTHEETDLTDSGSGRMCIVGPESLLVQSEGGYGDVFMFMRWIPLLKKQFGIGRIGLMIFKGMADFCDWRALGIDEVYRTDIDKIPFGKWKYSTSVMSLAACFGLESWDTIPGAAATLPFAALGDLPVGLPSKSDLFRLGFCWRAEENSSPIKTKSLDMETAAEIVRLLTEQVNQIMPETVEIHSLSPEKKDLYSTDSFMQPPGLIYLPEQMETWRKTASYLCSMDFVLTVDTAVGHLCGLLGVESLVLVPRGGCWRFGTEDNTVNPWYGYSKLYRQPVVLEWDPYDIARAALKEIERVSAAA